MERGTRLCVHNHRSYALYIRLDRIPPAIRDCDRRSDGSVGYHFLCHENTDRILLLRHQRSVARRRAADTGLPVYDEDHICHRCALGNAMGGAEGDDGTRRRVLSDTRKRAGTDVANHRLYHHRVGTCGGVPEQRKHRRHRYCGGSGKQISRLLTGSGTHFRRLRDSGQLYVHPLVRHLSRKNPQGGVRIVYDWH